MSSNKQVKVEEQVAVKSEESVKSDSQRPRRYKVTMLFLNSEVGSVIGKNGANIKSIKENTNCTLSFYDEFRRDRKLVILGPKESIPEAVKLTADSLLKARNEKEDSMKEETKVSMFWLLPKLSAVSLVGVKGANSKRLRDETHAIVSVMFDKRLTGPEVVTKLIGTPEEISEAVKLCINEFIQEQGSYRSTDGSFRNQGQAKNGSFRGHPLTSRPFTSRYKGPQQFKIECTQSIQLKKEYAGVVIGQKGRNVERIRRLSGARIRIDNPNENEEMARVTVVGRPSNVAIAYQYIEESIEIYMATGARQRAQAPKQSKSKRKSGSRVKSENQSAEEDLEDKIESKENMQIHV